MLAAVTELKNAQKVKEYLIKKKVIHPDYLVTKEMGLIYFPLLKKTIIPNARIIDTKFSFSKKEKVPELEDLLKKSLSISELQLIPKSQEIIGKILVLEIPEELQKKEKTIAEAYLKHNLNIETVVKKNDFYSGVYRTRKVQILAGKNTKETLHLENGVKIKLNIEKVYFSARSGNERLRIAHQIKKPEEVLVMFSGVAPYPLVIAKNSSAKTIYGIEINPIAHQYALQNIELNHFQKKITIYNGDVYKILPTLKEKFDRIAMPLPKTGEKFLPLALTSSKSNTIIHFYAFLGEEEIANEKNKIIDICEKQKRKIKVLKVVKCGQFSPHIFRICFDLKVIN